MRRIIFPRPFDPPSGLALGSFGQFELAYRKGTADEAVIAQSFDRDIFFSGVPEYQPRSGDTIVDIGAHIGAFSILAASRIGSGQVHAIEASRDTYDLLRINVALNRCTNIHPHHAALTDRDGFVTLHHARANWGHSLFRQPTGRAETVPSSSLAGFLDRNGIRKCSFMKLNCEGAEFPILLSTPSQVLKRIDIALVLYHCDFWKDNSESDLVAHLQSSGFHCTIHNRSEKRGWIIADRRIGG